MQEESTWRSDWGDFVRRVAELFGQGLDNAAVTERFAGILVTWEGTVAEKQASTEYSSGIRMDMPAVTVSLPDGRSATVDYLYLTLKPGEFDDWKDVAVGSPVRFTTQIKPSSGPFPGIAWDDLRTRSIILFLTDGARPLRG